MRTGSCSERKEGSGRRESFKLSYKEAVVGRGGAACEKDLERKSLGLCRDEQSIAGAMMNGVKENFCQPQHYIPQQNTARNPSNVKWAGHQNLGSDCKGKILQEESNQLHRGGEGRKGKSGAWDGKKMTWSINSQSEQGFGGREQDPSKEHLYMTLSRVSTGSKKYIAATGSGGSGGISTSVEITETALPAGCSTIGKTEKNFFPPQNKGSLVLGKTRDERKSIPVVSAKTFDAEETSETSSQNLTVCRLSSWPTFPNKKTVYFFPKTLNLPNYTFDMVYYQDPGESVDFKTVSTLLMLCNELAS